MLSVWEERRGERKGRWGNEKGKEHEIGVASPNIYGVGFIVVIVSEGLV